MMYTNPMHKKVDFEQNDVNLGFDLMIRIIILLPAVAH